MCTGGESNQGPLGPKSDALSTAPLRLSDFDLLRSEQKHHLSTRRVKKMSSSIPTTNRAVKLYWTARGLKFWILEVEGLFYLCSENKGADQLHSHRATDLRLCFRIFKTQFF